MDKVSSEKRSEIMSRIWSRDTKPELALKPPLEAIGFCYQAKVEGIATDFADEQHRIAIFVDGCFWHGCPRHYREPKSNIGFWRAKLERNRARDREQTARLMGAGWVVVRAWSCEARNLLGIFGLADCT